MAEMQGLAQDSSSGTIEEQSLAVHRAQLPLVRAEKTLWGTHQAEPGNRIDLLKG